MEPNKNIDIIQKLLMIFELPKTFKEFQNLDKEKRLELSKIQIIPDSINSVKDYKLSEWKKNILGEAKNYFEPIARQNSIIFMPNKIAEELERSLIEHYGIKKVKEDQSTQNLLKTICTEMQNYLTNESALIKGIDRVKNLLINNKIASEGEIEIKENPDKGANDSFITKIKGETYYIKNCSDDSNILGKTDGKAHSNELFVYKIMEYTSFGPEAKFLFGKYSSSGGCSSSYKGNYIMTKSLNEKDKNFLIDSEENQQEFKKALQNEDFSVDLSTASILNDLLSLTDTFGRNTRNYGLLIDNSKQKTGYSLKFVDHLPNANNGLFSLSDFKPELYSPREVIQNKSNQLDAEKHSVFKDLTDNRDLFKKVILDKKVNEKLSNFKEIINKAQENIKDLIKQHPENFIEKADDVLNSYFNKIEKNLEVYKRTACLENQAYTKSHL